jgi:hypothetical protein
MNYSEDEIEKDIFKVDAAGFDELALKIFLFQYRNNELYRRFCNFLRVEPNEVKSLEQIPFLPIQFFKSHQVITTFFVPEITFESSGTTNAVNSRHFVKKLSLYSQSFKSAFRIFYGEARSYCVLGLLPSYLERSGSSLVYMVKNLVDESSNKSSGFFLYDHEQLQQTILQNEAKAIPTLLIGVTYALLDFAENSELKLKHTIVMETGGMKGKRKEMTRQEVHAVLTNRLGINKIHSEYGMTELLSQAYSSADGIFNCPPWMKVMLRAEDDPLNILKPSRSEGMQQTGVVNIIDLANLYSCAFIATDDVGRLYHDGSFEILGRLDNSDIRGCGLMIL